MVNSTFLSVITTSFLLRKYFPSGTYFFTEHDANKVRVMQHRMIWNLVFCTIVESSCKNNKKSDDFRNYEIGAADKDDVIEIGGVQCRLVGVPDRVVDFAV